MDSTYRQDKIFRSVQLGRTIFSLERSVFPTMVAKFQTAPSTSTPTITYRTTTSIPKVRSPVTCNTLPNPIQTAAGSGSVVQLTRLASLSALLVLALVLEDLDQTTATTSARVNRVTSGQTPSTTSEPSMPFEEKVLKNHIYRYHFWPEGPTCVWPIDYTGNCTNTPGPCDCLPWQVKWANKDAKVNVKIIKSLDLRQ